ncbi:glycosyltransferase [Nonomuraea antimicrobica]
MNTSVVICVYTEERWEDIRQAVASVENQTRPAHELILVVDHNPGLHLKLKREYPRAIVVENTHEQGLSGGKNTGVATADGEIVAFLDDDAVAEPGWLEALEEGFQESGVVGVGAVPTPCGRRAAGRGGSRTSSTGRSAAPTAACPRSGRRSATSWAATPPSCATSCPRWAVSTAASDAACKDVGRARWGARRPSSASG